MDGIGNTELGGTTNDGNRHYAAIFKADGTQIAAFRQFLANPLPNYSGGDGGTIEYRLRLATSTGPTNTTVGSPVTVRYGMSRPEGPAPRIVAPADWVTTPGQWYALVARNIDPNPTVNFTSVDGIVFFNTVPADESTQPRFPDGQWQSFYSNTGSGSWGPRYGTAMTAQLQVEYADGRIAGVGYVYRRAVITLGSAAEVFTPRVNVPFSQIAFRAIGSGTLTLRLESGGGVVAQGSTISDDGGWDFVSASGTLRAGQSYRLVASGNGLTTKSIQKGSAYGFTPATYYGDGSVEGDSAADLQFYFR
jgi:hypothetical protein